MSEATKKRLLDRSFKYTRASETDVAATFRRIRREMKQAEAAKQADSHVLVMKRSAR